MVEFITTILKCFLVFYEYWQKQDAENKALYLARVKLFNDDIKKAMLSNRETFDENALIASLDADKKFRYQKYLELLEPQLKQGRGIDSLSCITQMCLNLLIEKMHARAVEILALPETASNRAKILAKELTGVV